MKIQKPSPEARPKVYALLRAAFPGSAYEEALVRRFHENGSPISEWVCIHAGKFIAYIAFSRAYRGGEVCGLHLAPMAVAPEFQGQGVGSELLRFSLRQEEVRNATLFVLGEPDYYRKFGFEPCSVPTCPYDTGNRRFLSIRNSFSEPFVVGYEAEFAAAGKPAKPEGKRRGGRRMP